VLSSDLTDAVLSLEYTVPNTAIQTNATEKETESSVNDISFPNFVETVSEKKQKYKKDRMILLSMLSRALKTIPTMLDARVRSDNFPAGLFQKLGSIQNPPIPT
jgi:KaiC/GvpD/RAD55 family RecA-like ATPase